MPARLLSLALAGLALAGAGGPEGAGLTKSPRARSTVLPLPRDGDVAIQQELDAARRTGTLAAYDLFLARHPEHALAVAARRERQRLLRVRNR